MVACGGQVARPYSYLWWPGQGVCAQRCSACQTVEDAPAIAPLHPWLWPAKAWQRVNVDFGRHFIGKMFLVIVDIYISNGQRL